MLQTGVQLDQQTFSCSICLDLLKDPVTIPCGHSYCMSCIKTRWDGEDGTNIHSCPQCTQTFTPRPFLVKNTLLADLVEQQKGTGLRPTAAADHCSAGAEDVACDVCTVRNLKAKIQQRIKDIQEDMKVLQQEVEAISRSADEAEKKNDEILTEMIQLLEERRRDMDQISSQQKTEVRRVKELESELEQEITELRRKDAEMDKLSHTHDHIQFLLQYPSVSQLREDPDSSHIHICPRSCFEDLTTALSELRDKLLPSLIEEWANMSLTITQPEPQTREEFMQFSCEITLDPNTVNERMTMSEENKRVTYLRPKQNYPPHPDRFTVWCQVLSRESLTGRCYWEVEWSGWDIRVAVAYKDIQREGYCDECRFGYNEKSWALYYDHNTPEFFHNGVQSYAPGPVSSRIGVYLDHTAGILSYYSVSETMTLIHRVQTTFTQPLYTGVFLWGVGSTAYFPQLQ